MASDAFIGVLTGLGAAHRERQKNIFDQEVERRSKYEQFLQKASTDPSYRPEAQDQFAQLYSTLIQTPYEKKLPKDFERQITDALTSVEGVTNLSQGGGPQQATTPTPRGGVQGPSMPIPEPDPFKGKMPARYSAEEKFAEAMRLLNAQLQARSTSEIETERAKLAMQPEEFRSASPESFTYSSKTGQVVHKSELQPDKPPSRTNYEPIEIALPGQPGPLPAMRQLDPDDPQNVGKIFIRTPQGLQDVTAQAKLYQKPVQPPATIRITGATQEAVSGMPADVGDALAKATFGKSQAQILNATQTVQRMLQRGDQKAVRNTIKQLALEGEPVDDRRRISSQRTVINALQEIRPLLEQVPTNLLKGTIEDVVRALGTTQDPRYVYIATRLGQLNQQYRRGMTGAQFSQAEAKEYARLLPNIGNLPAVNKAQINAMIDAFTAESDIYWEFKLGPQWSDRFDSAAPASGGVAGGGAGKAPAGVDQAVWDVMTPQERALWK